MDIFGEPLFFLPYWFINQVDLEFTKFLLKVKFIYVFLIITNNDLTIYPKNPENNTKLSSMKMKGDKLWRRQQKLMKQNRSKKRVSVKPMVILWKDLKLNNTLARCTKKIKWGANDLNKK